MSQQLKICLAASAGGHLSQLTKLEEAWRGHDTFFVTTGEMVTRDLADRYHARVYTVGESNHTQPFRVMRTLVRCMVILLRERPDVVVSTGAAHGCICSLICKLMRGRIVWVDSIANVERLSLSGRIVRPIADLCITQWPRLSEKDPLTEYHGQII